MKNTFLSATLVLLCYTYTFAGTPPAEVQKSFDLKFPHATAVKWDKENAHEYEASFSWKNEKYSANFSDKGEWLETESATSFNLLPEKVQNTFNASHKGTMVKAAAKIEPSKGAIKYEVEFKQGIKTVEVFYDSDGAIIK